MKKLIVIICVAALSLSFFGCGKKDDKLADPNKEKQKKTETQEKHDEHNGHDHDGHDH